MTDRTERIALFDEWARTYDPSKGDEAFPFAGYEAILTRIAQRAGAGQGMRVLDLGIGTGNLAAKFVPSGCEVWGVDFSSEMIKKVKERLPEVHVVQADVLQLPAALPKPFDRIVSSYVLHEFDDGEKVSLLRGLADEWLAPAGTIVIGDVAFENAKVRARAHARWKRLWDEDEFYWAAEEAIHLLAEHGLRAEYEQVSACAGVFVVTATA